MINVLSHSGIDLERDSHLAPNSLAAFRWCAERGLGVELDLQLGADQELVCAAASAPFADVLAIASEFPRWFLAIRLEGGLQTRRSLAQFTEALKGHKNLSPRLLLLGIQREDVMAVRHALPGVDVAASVSDQYDVARYQSIARDKLISVADFLAEKSHYNWVWLDEWDRVALMAPAKELYTPELVERLHEKGLKVALVSPDLHKAEGHQDARSIKALERRWRDLIALKPEAICTDYPARLSTLLGS